MKGLMLFRKFGQDVIIDDHITLKTSAYISTFKVGSKFIDLLPVESLPALSNWIPYDNGHGWVMPNGEWSEARQTLKLVSAIDLANKDFTKPKATMVTTLNEPQSIPEGLILANTPHIDHHSAVFDLDSETGQHLELVCPVGKSVEFYFEGLKASITVEGFRLHSGVTFRLLAAAQHSILRSELIRR